MSIANSLDTRAAAARLGVTTTTLERWRAAGVGPTWLRIGARKIWYPETAIEAYIADATHLTRPHVVPSATQAGMAAA